MINFEKYELSNAEVERCLANIEDMASQEASHLTMIAYDDMV